MSHIIGNLIVELTVQAALPASHYSVNYLHFAGGRWQII